MVKMKKCYTNEIKLKNYFNIFMRLNYMIVFITKYNTWRKYSFSFLSIIFIVYDVFFSVNQNYKISLLLLLSKTVSFWIIKWLTISFNLWFAIYPALLHVSPYDGAIYAIIRSCFRTINTSSFIFQFLSFLVQLCHL